MTQDQMQTDSNKKKPKRVIKYSRLALLIIPIIILVIIIVIIVRINIWNKGIAYEVDPNLILEADTEDLMYLTPLEDKWKNEDDKERRFVILGNDTVSKFEADNDISSIIAKETNATVYNCGFPGSYLTSTMPMWDEEYSEPLDSFCYYWLNDSIATKDFSRQYTALEKLGDRVDTTLYKKQLSVLEDIDFATIDLVLLAYDSADYCTGTDTYNTKEPYNITSICGSYAASFDKFTVNYPNIQLMIVSPNFCFATDAQGNKVPCDRSDLGYGSLTKCLTNLRNFCFEYKISYLDNYYGVQVTEENADNYLLDDSRTLNQEGRNMVGVRTAKYINLYLQK